MSKKVAIIGAGVAGLSCAKIFHESHIPFVLFEKTASVGGRIRTRHFKQLTIDEGFQVYLPQYKVSKKILSPKALDLCHYPSGASIITNNGNYWFGQSKKYPKAYRTGNKIPLVLSDYFQLFLDLFNGYFKPSSTSLFQTSDHLTSNYSKLFNETFLTPFFRGVFLDPHCQKSLDLFRYYLCCFFLGGGTIPRQGMEQIPLQIQSTLPKKNIVFNTPIDKIKDNTIIINNKKHEFNHIIIATDASSCFKLVDIPIPKNYWNSVSNYIFVKKSETTAPPLTFIAKKSIISHFNIPTLISNQLAPKNTHIMNVTTFKKGNPLEIETEIQQLTNEPDWEFLYEHHIDQALPKYTLKIPAASPHISFCGDWTTFASIESSISSGIQCANKIKQTLSR